MWGRRRETKPTKGPFSWYIIRECDTRRMGALNGLSFEEQSDVMHERNGILVVIKCYQNELKARVY